MRRTVTINESATLLSLTVRSEEVISEWCAECADEVIWIGIPTVLEGLISRLTEAGVVHLYDGRVCSRSLMDHGNSQEQGSKEVRV